MIRCPGYQQRKLEAILTEELMAIDHQTNLVALLSSIEPMLTAAIFLVFLLLIFLLVLDDVHP